MEFPVQLYRHRPATEPARGERRSAGGGARALRAWGASLAFRAEKSQGNRVVSEEGHRCHLARNGIGIRLLGLASSHPSPDSRPPPRPLLSGGSLGTVGQEKKTRKGRYICLELSLTLEGLNVFIYLVTFPTLNTAGIRALGFLCCGKSRWLMLNVYEICIK